VPSGVQRILSRFQTYERKTAFAARLRATAGGGIRQLLYGSLQLRGAQHRSFNTVVRVDRPTTALAIDTKHGAVNLNWLGLPTASYGALARALIMDPLLSEVTGYLANIWRAIEGLKLTITN
jgi:hypothetical protein